MVDLVGQTVLTIRREVADKSCDIAEPGCPSPGVVITPTRDKVFAAGFTISYEPCEGHVDLEAREGIIVVAADSIAVLQMRIPSLTVR